MTIIAKVYFSHPDMALATIISSFPETNIRVLREVSTDQVSDSSFFVIETDRIEDIERELAADHTVERAHRVSSYEGWPVYSVQFTPDTLLLGSVVTEQDGFALTAYQQDGGWVERWQLPDRESLQSVWEYANDKSFEFDIRKINRLSEGDTEGDDILTEKQRYTLVHAYNNGYFEIPGNIELGEIADDLDISTTAASGRIKRGMKNLIESSVEDVS